MTSALYALQDISAGIEITASYLTDEELLQPHQARRAFILDAMGFHCLCDPCAGPPEGIKASDARVEQIRHFYTEWSKWTGDTVACNHNLRREIETYLALVRDESLPQYAGWAYNMLCHYHASNGQREGVITAARRFVDTAATMLGPKAAAQEPEAQWILHPTTNRCWAEMPEVRMASQRAVQDLTILRTRMIVIMTQEGSLKWDVAGDVSPSR